MFLLSSFLAVLAKDKKSTRILNRKSRIANYLNHLNQAEQDVEKAKYEAEEPFARHKNWEEFVRIAISTQILEKGKEGDNVRITTGQGKEIFSAKNDKGNLFKSKATDDDFHKALRNVNERAREHGATHAKRHHGTKTRHHHREPGPDADEDHREQGGNDRLEPGVRRRRHLDMGTDDDDARGRTPNARRQREEEGFVYDRAASRPTVRRGVRDLSPNQQPDIEAGLSRSRLANNVYSRTDPLPNNHRANLQHTDDRRRPHARADHHGPPGGDDQQRSVPAQHETPTREIVMPAPPPIVIEIPVQPPIARTNQLPSATISEADSRRSFSSGSSLSFLKTSQPSSHAANIVSGHRSNKRSHYSPSVDNESGDRDRHEPQRRKTVGEGKRQARSEHSDKRRTKQPIRARSPEIVVPRVGRPRSGRMSQAFVHGALQPPLADPVQRTHRTSSVVDQETPQAHSRALSLISGAHKTGRRQLSRLARDSPPQRNRDAEGASHDSPDRARRSVHSDSSGQEESSPGESSTSLAEASWRSEGGRKAPQWGSGH